MWDCARRRCWARREGRLKGRLAWRVVERGEGQHVHLRIGPLDIGSEQQDIVFQTVTCDQGARIGFPVLGKRAPARQRGGDARRRGGRSTHDHELDIAPRAAASISSTMPLTLSRLPINPPSARRAQSFELRNIGCIGDFAGGAGKGTMDNMDGQVGRQRCPHNLIDGDHHVGGVHQPAV